MCQRIVNEEIVRNDKVKVENLTNLFESYREFYISYWDNNKVSNKEIMDKAVEVLRLAYVYIQGSWKLPLEDRVAHSIIDDMNDKIECLEDFLKC